MQHRHTNSWISHLLAPVVAVAIAGSGCTKKEEAKPAPTPTPAATPTAEAVRRADPACVAAYAETAPTKEVEVGGKKLALRGTRVDEVSTDADDELVLGLVADVKEDTAENLANLDAILKFFKDTKVEAIVVNGDLGDDQKQIESVLNKLSESGLPMFAIIGNREGRAAFNGAVAGVQARYPGLVNLNAVRTVVLDDAALVSVPGYHNKVYIHAEDGCQYTAADLEATKPALAAAKGKTTVLISHGPPKQDGADALDRTLEQVNVGDPALRDFIRDNGIKFGVFANIHEAGGRATNLAGTSLIGESKPSEELFVSTGPADSVRWTMNDGTESVGMAAALMIKADKASFKVFRVPAKAPAPPK